MSRITKDPQIRMAEILDKAEELFNTHGYQETQVSDIVKAIGVAQGTFYYYFKSKEQVVEAIVRRELTQIIDQMDSIVVDEELSAPKKLEAVINTMLNNMRGKDGLRFEYLHNDKYLHILDRVGRQAQELFAPRFLKIVQEGVRQEYFKVPYPEETVNFIIAIIKCLLNSLYKQDATEKMTQRLAITKRLMETALGI